MRLKRLKRLQNNFWQTEKEKEQLRQWVIPIPTFGGLQVWTDHSYRQGYRIQHNTVTDNWRLLDDNDRRWMWGTRGQCEAFLNKVSKRSQSKRDHKHCIVLIHGLMRTKHSMTPLKNVLDKKCDCEIVCFSYASTRGKIGAHAAALQSFLKVCLKPGLYLLLAIVWVILSSVTSLQICKLTRTTTNCSIVVNGW